MDRRWLPLNALRAFEAAGRHTSFTAAASSLLVSQSAVSRHVIGLEDLIGVPLFDRKPHQLSLTEAGRRLLPVVTKSFDRIDEVLEEIRAEKGLPRRSLKVTLPHTFAHQLAVPILRDFRRDYPDIAIDIESRPPLGPMERAAEISVVYSEPKVTDRVLDLLWMEKLSILCHPDVAARATDVPLVQFLSTNDLLHVRIDDRPRNYPWEIFIRAIGFPEVKVDRGLVFDTAQMAVLYAMSGEGLALVDPLLFQEEIAAGKIVSPFAHSIDDGYGYYLAIHPDDLGDTAVSVFRSWLISRFSKPPFTARPGGSTSGG
ncbi:MAG: LysR substrate-binding domain-containing protein [Ancalomicrobiaceae bacterium]|nr:LysR substrate-binding domain-containing protein [Ancalomicrobiaceae bacterium]